MSGKRSRSRWFVLLILAGVGLGAVLPVFLWQPVARGGDTGSDPKTGQEPAGSVDLKAYRPDETFLSETEEENPGWYVNVNWDDDDKDGWNPDDHSPGATYTADKDDSLVSGNGCTEDDDLWKFTVEIVPSSIHGLIRLTFNEAKVKVYVNRSKQNPFASDNTVNFTGQPITLYLEGRTGSATFRDVELKGVYVGATPNVGGDYVKISVFEVTLTGVFGGQQQDDCSVRHREFLDSNDRNGKISYEDADGDGTTGDGDTYCNKFRNPMEDQGTVSPKGVKDEVTFDFKRELRGKVWKVPPGGGDWTVLSDKTDKWYDDTGSDRIDNTPSSTDHIYQIDGPGWGMGLTSSGKYVFIVHNFREWARVKLYGTWYHCSDFLRWHSQIYLKPRPSNPMYLRRAGASPEGPGPEWSYQKLGAGWQTIPAEPPPLP